MFNTISLMVGRLAVPYFWDTVPETSSQPELNPLTNPVLERNLGRWAQAYFSNPPGQRELAISKLLEESRVKLLTFSPPKELAGNFPPDLRRRGRPTHGRRKTDLRESSPPMSDLAMVELTRLARMKPGTAQFSPMKSGSKTSGLSLVRSVNIRMLNGRGFVANAGQR